MQENKEHCLLYNREYISGFGKAFRMPMWTSYTVPKPVSRCVCKQAWNKKSVVLQYSEI